MSARTKARKRAVDALYAAELRDGMAKELLEETKQQVEDRQNQDEIFSFANELVTGVLSNQLEIDETISSMAQNWSLDRMPAVDRAILRLAVYEINFADLEPAIAISEAVSLANELSTDESGAFVNGVLSAVVATRKPI
ncbi:MAG: transcription antitermination factor NusB [Micrococcales bacterium]|nr:transcription antitermination factor NusB [Micrococcales bacterium]NBS60501.1 transcription antitermination factor NusB [Microbacteriaceae bacterium]NBX94144.1 transcription antitermination factor NusB [Actinomycetota bacterium]NBS85361.1 transcription antitermination factor NusB [Micrococcales bacterium]NDC18858.1 transcription antitermination factor NusB [Microbacteriaceae bacterium]